MGDFKTWIYIFLVTLFPAVELRGAIPLAVLKYKLPVLSSAIIVIIANILVTPIVFLMWDLIIFVFSKIPPLDRLLKRYLLNLQKRAKPYVDKYGFWGLMIFVAIPLPGTGAYSGALAAEILGMDKLKAFISISLGVIEAGIIVTLITTGALKLF
ncbi:MAG: ligand-binding protein SH3 [Caldisericum exile]|uniref:Ligand-binding protein SH3 n=1 Tax=Caldisericum exile TaxID=693075 RepID=A0A2J6XA82_9BACT|nr:MAG: ligand-binding protein SH3 [Caldisericum exile]